MPIVICPLPRPRVSRMQGLYRNIYVAEASGVLSDTLCRRLHGKMLFSIRPASCT